MDRRKMNWITTGFIVLVVLVVALMLTNGLRRTAHITLPTETTSPGQTEETPSGDSALTVVEVKPETVQSAIETLSRPEKYRRTVWVEQLWSGGSGQFSTSVSVSGGRTRTDRTLADKRVRHTITDGETTHIWYNNERTVYAGAAETVSADSEQAIPTYEDILRLPVEEISTADFRTISDINCIFVETAEQADGYLLRYWVSVDNGLLVAAEKLLDGETVYRMGAPSVEIAAPTEGDFTLPDGAVVPPRED